MTSLATLLKLTKTVVCTSFLKAVNLPLKKASKSQKKNIVTSIGAGPEGMTIRSDSKETTNGYFAQKEGFVVNINDGRIYVVTTDSPNNHDGVVEIPEKDIITKIGAGVGNMTVRSDSIETINAYLAKNRTIFQHVTPCSELLRH